jgi:outer membrane protein TolC
MGALIMNRLRLSARILLLGCAGGLFLLMTGCGVDQEKEIAQYRAVLDHANLPSPAEVSENQPLSLQQSMALANLHNENLGLRGEDYVQALIDKNRAVANFLPTVGFQPSYTIAGKPGNRQTIRGLSTHGDTVQGYVMPVVGNINVFNGFADPASLRAAESAIAQRRDLLLDLQATILLNVAQTYYQVLRSEQAVQVLQHSLQLQESRLSDVEQQLRNGLATQLAVSQTRAQVDNTRVQLVQAQSDVRNGRFTLALLIGVAHVENPLVDDFTVPDDPGSEASFEQAALSTRNDVLAAEHELDVAREAVNIAVAQYYPSVTLNVSALLSSTAYSQASKWNAVLAANLPVFSAGRIRADVRTAWSRLRQAALEESLVRRQALHDVQSAYENVVTAARRIHELEDEVQAANEAYEQARNSFLNGLGINLDVLSAQDQLLNAQLQLTGARFDRTVFFLDLIRASGRLPTPQDN